MLELTLLSVVTVVALAVVCVRQQMLISGILESADRERQTLLQRVQAPEQAVVQHVQANTTLDLPAVDPFDDDDFRKAKENMDRLLHEVGG